MFKKDALRHYGSVGAIADALEISRIAVYQWDSVVPRGSAFELYVHSNRAIPIHREHYGLSARPTRVDLRATA